MRALVFITSSLLLAGCFEKVKPKAPSDAGSTSTESPIARISSSTTTPILYELSFPEPQAHYLSVKATFPTNGRNAVELFLPVWTPGSYLVREFMRNVEGIEAFDASGESLAVTRTRKNRVQIEAAGRSEVQLRYRVYANEVSVRTSFVDADGAFLNGTTLFFGDPEAAAAPHLVAITPAPGWRDIKTPLEPSEAQASVFSAANYDELMDSPILVASSTTVSFELDGIEHEIVTFGDTAFWDHDRAAADVQRLVERQREHWGSLPYPHYMIFNLLMDTRGGLEHRNGCAIMASGLAMKDESAYADWISVVSHEIFHAWNVKRLRPAEFNELDYENEVYTRSLWIAEGITSYYDDLLARRAGVFDRKTYFARLAKTIDRHRATSGRLIQDLESASYDAWIKFYRPDENSANSRTSYYVQGALLAFVLDAKIREATKDTKSLDDVMRRAYALYADGPGYTDAQFQSVVEEVAGRRVREWLADSLRSTKELEVDDGLDYFGLRFAEGKKPTAPKPGFLGLKTRSEGEQVFVLEIVRDGPAWRAGISAGDEILAIGDRRLVSSRQSEILGLLSEGEATRIWVNRRGRVRELPIVLSAAPASNLSLEPLPWSNAAHSRRLAAWLGPERSQGENR